MPFHVRRFTLLFLVLAFAVTSRCEASPYLFDFHFDQLPAFPVPYPAADIVYRADTIDADTLFYVSGDLNGYTAPILGIGVYGYQPVRYTGYYVSGGGFYNGDGSVGGFEFLALTPTGPGVYNTLYGNLAGRAIIDDFGGGLEFRYGTGLLTVTEVATPEPSGVLLFGTGLLAAGYLLRRRTLATD